MTTADPRRMVPRTDVVLADARLAEATDRLGRSTVKDGGRRAQQDQARHGASSRRGRRDAAVAALAGDGDVPASR